ncbi:MAG TPA: glycine zipper family protein [Crenalkalicoccus sp.]|jgi:hypothetical protein|nr:glycine zipper family protein [Crenalkalicoccus sp.]
MPGSRFFLVLTVTLALGACAVAPPTGPTVLALPPEGKDLARFQQEDGSCRQYASAQIGYGSPAQAATQSAVGSAAVGTAVGATAGALLGAAAGGAGVGAAAGAGTGLLFGSAVGGNNAYASGAGLQQRYDMAYAQCMSASGNRLQAFPAAGYYPPYAYGPYAYGPYAYPAYYGGYYGPWFGPAFSLGFFGRFGSHFHHHGFFHGGFRRH